MAKRASRWLKPKGGNKANFSLKIDQAVADKWTQLEARLEAAGQAVNRADVIEEMLSDAIEEINAELDAQDAKRPASAGA